MTCRAAHFSAAGSPWPGVWSRPRRSDRPRTRPRRRRGSSHRSCCRRTSTYRISRNDSWSRSPAAGSSGIQFVSGPAAQFRFQPPKSPGGPAPTATAWVKAPLDRAGLPKGRGVYVTEPVLDSAGVWAVEVRAQGERVPFAIQVNAKPVAPVVGQAAPLSPSPTTTDTLGVSPICTRQPACPLHTVSLSTLIGAGKPVAALFATPARCQSQYCGPVLDELLNIMGPYKDRITFVHIEIYQALTGTAHVPTVDAWRLASEPWLFGIDPAGVIQARLDGAFGGDEMKALLDGLAQ